MREILVSSEGHTWPFSKGLVVESLLNAEVERELAIAIARRVEQRLLDENRRIIDPQTLKAIVADELEEGLAKGETELVTRFRAQTPVFEDITVLDGERRVPFSKGILARSLEIAGLVTRDAFELAKTLEQQLRLEGITAIERAELERKTVEAISEQLGVEAGEAYLERYQQARSATVLEENGVGFPYSKGILAQSLLATGLSPADAHRLAREVEIRLLGRGSAAIARSELRQLVAALLQEELGEDFARRYHLLRAIRRPVKPIHILIGGVTGTGKSVLATEIAYRLGITRIESTDSVRQVMRAMISKDLLPELHASTFDAWTAHLEPPAPGVAIPPRPTRDQLIDGFRDQVFQVAVGLRAIIERATAEHTSLVLEGVHVVPGFLPSGLFRDAIVAPMVVVVRSESEHRKRFYSRDRETNRHRPIERYLEFFNEIRALQRYVERLARAQGVPVIDGESLDRAAESVIEVIAQHVLAATGGAV